jgi:thiamine biosynthesis lipoprotein
VSIHTTTFREQHVAVMGTTAHIVVVDGGRRLVSAAVDRLRDLEQRWSRFLPGSETSRLNRHAGAPQQVSAETALLVGLAQEGWRRTAGRYDPTLLHALRATGYTDGVPDRPMAHVAVVPPPAHEPQLCGQIVLDPSAGTVCMPASAGFDPGGIGKGLAADLVTADLVATGVAGACVNVGGDLRVWGRGPRDGRWRIAMPAWEDRVVALHAGAVATSGVTHRTWTVAGRLYHHVIDPATLLPSDTGTVGATVVARAAWLAEVYALAALLTTPPEALGDLRRWGVEGCIVEAGGRTWATPRLTA